MPTNRDGKDINDYLADEERRIRSMELHPSNPNYSVSSVKGVTVTSNTKGPQVRVMTTFGMGQSQTLGYTEFPAGGDPRFRAILAEMLRTHISKSNDYGTGKDIYANYRSAEVIGVPAWKSCFVRALEKVQRLTNAFGGKDLNHESVTDSFVDLANHIVISKVLYDEAQAKTCGNPDCDC